MIVKGETPRCEWSQEWRWDDMITVINIFLSVVLFNRQDLVLPMSCPKLIGEGELSSGMRVQLRKLHVSNEHDMAVPSNSEST